MRKLSILAVLLLLAACGSGGLGDLGGILGSPSPSTPSSVNGTVNFVDTSAQRVDLNVNSVNNLRSSQGSDRSPLRECNSEHTANHSQQHAFGEQLANHPC